MGSPSEESDATTVHIVLSYGEGDDVTAIEQAMLSRTEAPRPRRGAPEAELVLAGIIVLRTLSTALLGWVSTLHDESLYVELEASTRWKDHVKIKVSKGSSPKREEVVVIAPDGKKKPFTKDDDPDSLVSSIDGAAEQRRAAQ